MKNNLSERQRVEEVYHDTVHRKGIIQKGHLESGKMAHYQFFYNLIGNTSGLRVLDVGCGVGWLSIKLAKEGAKVCGIDISGELVNTAIEEAAKQGCSETTNFKKMAVEKLEFEDQSFDLVIGSAILHHTDIRAAISNIRRVLSPRGRAVFIEPLNENIALKIWRKLTPWRRSTTERALLKHDLDYITSVFPNGKHHYFALTSIVSTGLLVFFPQCRILNAANRFLEQFDASMSGRFPFLGLHYAVVVLELT